MATRPWLTASMSAVWPASREGENYRELELNSERGDVRWRQRHAKSGGWEKEGRDEVECEVCKNTFLSDGQTWVEFKK